MSQGTTCHLVVPGDAGTQRTIPSYGFPRYDHIRLGILLVSYLPDPFSQIRLLYEESSIQGHRKRVAQVRHEWRPATLSANFFVCSLRR